MLEHDTTAAMQAMCAECKSGQHSICGSLWLLACTQLTLSTIEIFISIVLTCSGKFLAGGTTHLEMYALKQNQQRALMHMGGFS